VLALAAVSRVLLLLRVLLVAMLRAAVVVV
jgi:hypothetical protein